MFILWLAFCLCLNNHKVSGTDTNGKLDEQKLAKLDVTGADTDEHHEHNLAELDTIGADADGESDKHELPEPDDQIQQSAEKEFFKADFSMYYSAQLNLIKWERDPEWEIVKKTLKKSKAPLERPLKYGFMLEGIVKEHKATKIDQGVSIGPIHLMAVLSGKGKTETWVYARGHPTNTGILYRLQIHPNFDEAELIFSVTEAIKITAEVPVHPIS